MGGCAIPRTNARMAIRCVDFNDKQSPRVRDAQTLRCLRREAGGRLEARTHPWIRVLLRVGKNRGVGVGVECHASTSWKKGRFLMSSLVRMQSGGGERYLQKWDW